MADRRTSQMTSIRRQQKQKGRVIPTVAERLARREDLRRQKESESQATARRRVTESELRIGKIDDPAVRAETRRKEAAAREAKIRADSQKVTNVIDAAKALKAAERRRRKEIEEQTR